MEILIFLPQGNHTHYFSQDDHHAHSGCRSASLQLTVSLKDQQSYVLLAPQVSTRPAKILHFFDQFTQRCAEHNEALIAVLEVCGFNGWLIRMLRDYRCNKVILIQPQKRKRCKTDRRDAAALSELQLGV